MDRESVMNEITRNASAKPLLTVREVAQILRLSSACIYTMVASGRLPHLRVGNGRGSIRFSHEDLDRFLNSRRAETAPPLQQPVRRQLKHLKLPRRGSAT